MTIGNPNHQRHIKSPSRPTANGGWLVDSAFSAFTVLPHWSTLPIEIKNDEVDSELPAALTLKKDRMLCVPSTIKL